jgi:hypothetical protein
MDGLLERFSPEKRENFRMKKLRIVFVHLNTSIPEHLLANCRRMKSLFPECDLHLIHNSASDLRSELGITTHKIDISKYEHIFRNHKWSMKFRQGFWQSSMLRILVLEQFHELYPEDPILHVESDVILMPNFPFREICQQNLPHWNSFGHDADVGALLYSPEKKYTKLLVDSLRLAIEKNQYFTDMTALNFVRKENPETFKLLPTSSLDSSFEKLPFIFDGAIFGMWLFGQDPRNHYGFQPRFVNIPESKYQIMKKTIFFSDAGLLTLREEFKVSQIVTLHLHCKDTRLFKPDSKLFKKRIRSASRRVNILLFRPKVFLHLALSAVKNKEIKGFIYHFPLLGRAVRIIRKISRATRKYFVLRPRKRRR